MERRETEPDHKTRRWRFRGITAASRILGVSLGHLRKILTGERSSPEVLARYRAFIAATNPISEGEPSAPIVQSAETGEPSHSASYTPVSPTEDQREASQWAGLVAEMMVPLRSAVALKADLARVINKLDAGNPESPAAQVIACAIRVSERTAEESLRLHTANALDVLGYFRPSEAEQIKEMVDRPLEAGRQTLAALTHIRDELAPIPGTSNG